MLKKPCPYHQGPVKHALEDCSMLRRYYTRLGLPDDDTKQKGTDDWDEDKDGAAAQEGTPRSLLDQGSHPQYLDWSREAITFD